MPAPTPAFVREHPEFEAICYDYQWPCDFYTRQRVAAAEVLWALKTKGAIYDDTNATKQLRIRLRKMKEDGEYLKLSEHGHRSILRKLADAGMIHWKVNGRQSVVLKLLTNDLPANPFDARCVHGQGASTCLRCRFDLDQKAAARHAAVQEEVKANGFPEPAPVEPEPVDPTPDPTPDAGPDVPAKVTVSLAPAADPLADLLADYSDKSLAEKALLMMRLAGDVFTEAMARSVVMDVPEAQVPVVAIDDEQSARLAGALEEAARLRDQLRRAQEGKRAAEISAESAKAVVRSEREKNRILEHNMAAIAKGERVPDESGLRALNAMVREVPRVAS